MTALVLALALAAGVAASPARSASPDRVSFFEVPLGCPAVKDLGCGSLAAPVMAELERNRKVSEVWLNHPGTVLAVVWRDLGDHRGGAAVVKRAFQGRGLDIATVEGELVHNARRDFETGAKWYRPADVDRLSQEEAKVLASRLVDHVEETDPLPAERSRALRAELAPAVYRCLRAGCAAGMKDVLAVAGKHLDARGLARFREGLNEGLESLSGER